MKDNGRATYGKGAGGIVTESLCFKTKEEATIRYSGDLPHWEQGDVLQFITFRLADSLPQIRLEDFKEQKETWMKEHPKPWDIATIKEYSTRFEKQIDEWLDSGYGECLLKDNACRRIVVDTIRHFDGQRYDLYDFVIMPNHVHIVLRPLNFNLHEIMQSIKGFSAYKINKHLNRTGKVWEREYFDRIIRSVNDYDRISEYILQNFNQSYHIK